MMPPLHLGEFLVLCIPYPSLIFCAALWRRDSHRMSGKKIIIIIIINGSDVYRGNFGERRGLRPRAQRAGEFQRAKRGNWPQLVGGGTEG